MRLAPSEVGRGAGLLVAELGMRPHFPLGTRAPLARVSFSYQRTWPRRPFWGALCLQPIPPTTCQKIARLDRQTREESAKFRVGCVEERLRTSPWVRHLSVGDRGDKMIFRTSARPKRDVSEALPF